MSNPNDLDLNEVPAQVEKVSDVQMPTIDFDAPMEIKKVSSPKRGVVEVNLVLLEHPVDDNKPSVFGDNTGKDSVGGKLMYAFKHGHHLIVSATSVQSDKKGGGDE